MAERRELGLRVCASWQAGLSLRTWGRTCGLSSWLSPSCSRRCPRPGRGRITGRSLSCGETPPGQCPTLHCATTLAAAQTKQSHLLRFLPCEGRGKDQIRFHVNTNDSVLFVFEKHQLIPGFCLKQRPGLLLLQVLLLGPFPFSKEPLAARGAAIRVKVRPELRAQEGDPDTVTLLDTRTLLDTHTLLDTRTFLDTRTLPDTQTSWAGLWAGPEGPV